MPDSITAVKCLPDTVIWNGRRVQLALVGTTFPRRELAGVGELKGAMRLIDAFERKDLPVTVGFCSSTVLPGKQGALCVRQVFQPPTLHPPEV